MKKTFPLEVPGKKTPRVIDSIKHEVRKYLKRERRKKLPEGTDYWDFECRVGLTSNTAETTHVKTINQTIETATSNSPTSVYIEIIAKAKKRNPKTPKENSPNLP